MTLNLNKETKKASLSILDREERKQREMWGMSKASVEAHCSNGTLTLFRHNTGIPQQSRSRRVGRAYCDSKTRRGGI